MTTPQRPPVIRAFCEQRNHPDPDLCVRAGMHVTGNLYRLYQVNAEYHGWIESLAEARHAARKDGDQFPPVPKFRTCVYLGEPTGEQEQCHPCKGNVRLQVLTCNHPAHGTTNAKLCELCPDYVRDPNCVHRDTSVERMLELIREVPPRRWLHGWASWPVTREAHKVAFTEAAASLPEYPGGFGGRGVVICAGGWRFFASLYVTVRVLRYVGCTLPVEVWYLGDRGEFAPRMGEIMAPYGPLTWVDGDAVRRERGVTRRLFDGWHLKPFAAQWSRFREVLFLDADCYPVKDPSFLFELPQYQEKGAIFWPEIAGRQLENRQWEWLGLKPVDTPDFESGQLLVNKERCWKELELTNWLCDHSDWTWNPSGLGLYGDKSCWLLAWWKIHLLKIASSSGTPAR